MKHLTIISLLLSIATFSILASGQTVRPKTSQQSVGKQSQEVDEFIKRFGVQEHRNLLDGALWTLTHDYSEFKQMEEVLKTFQSYFEALSKYEQGDSSSIEKIGGIKAFKNKLAEWLKDDDQSIRAFAAVVLGISRKHKITFDEAESVFNDPFVVTFADEFHSLKEERFISIGLSNVNHVLLIVHTEGSTDAGEISIRLISCRKATVLERKIYE